MTLTVSGVQAAAQRIAPYVRRTPLVASRQPGLWLKLENQQRTGAFKARGAFAALTALSPDQRARGVVTHSSGNHGRALAEAARQLGCPATVVVPDTALPHKVAAIAAAGAHIEVVPAAQRAGRAAELAATGMTMIPPFDHEDVMAGQGTVGLEILAQAAQAGQVVRRVWAPVGGGGLLSGIAVAVAGTDRSVTVVGAEPVLAGDFADSVRRGRRVTWSVADVSRTIADGLRLPSVGERPWQHLHALRIDAVTVSEEQIVQAMEWLDEAGVRAEPSGAVAVAAARSAGRYRDGIDVAVVSGGNRAGADR